MSCILCFDHLSYLPDFVSLFTLLKEETWWNWMDIVHFAETFMERQITINKGVDTHLLDNGIKDWLSDRGFVSYPLVTNFLPWRCWDLALVGRYDTFSRVSTCHTIFSSRSRSLKASSICLRLGFSFISTRKIYPIYSRSVSNPSLMPISCVISFYIFKR